MPVFPIRIQPGVDVEKTQSLNKGGFSVSSLIRFRQGLAEAMLGWTKICNSAVAGVARAMHWWSDLSGQGRYAIGTNTNLYVFPFGVPVTTPLQDITPASFVPGPASSGSTPYSLLVWSLDNFGQDLIACPSGQGLFFWVPGSPGVAQPIVSQAYLVGGNIAPTALVWQPITNGGFSIAINGTVQNISGLNFTAVLNQNDINTIINAALVPLGASSTVTVNADGTWTFKITVTSPTGTLSYASAPTTGGATDISLLIEWTAGSAVVLAPGGAPPAHNQGQIVLDQIQIILTFGSTPVNGGSQDAMLVRWCNQSDFTTWVASTTNQAGSYRLPHGSRIIGALQIPGLALLWTDIGLWAMQYIGFPLVFSFQAIGQNCGLIGEHAMVVLGQIVYWMSDHGFFLMSAGGPVQLECPVWDVVFKNLQSANQDKVIAGTDYHYSEAWWFFPSINGNTGEIDSYVKVNIDTKSWDYGPATPGVPNQFSRTAWTDQNQPGYPISVDLAGFLEEMDQGFTVNGAAIQGLIQTGYFDIQDGKAMLSIDQYLPDFLWDGPSPSLSITLLFRSYPDETPTQMGPFTITPATKYVTLRKPTQINIAGTVVTAYPPVRGREVAFEIQTISGWWRWGNNRLRAQPTGDLP